VPPPYGYPPVRFQCPYCGWVEARYESSRFTCTRCGRTA
jgi:ribosomal protein S27AE